MRQTTRRGGGGGDTATHHASLGGRSRFAAGRPHATFRIRVAQNVARPASGGQEAPPSQRAPPTHRGGGERADAYHVGGARAQAVAEDADVSARPRRGGQQEAATMLTWGDEEGAGVEQRRLGGGGGRGGRARWEQYAVRGHGVGRCE